MDPLAAGLERRPWPLPRRPWALAMRWHDLLFMHWPVPGELLRSHLRPGLALDTYDGQAWLGIVPFGMTRVRPRGVPPLPRLSSSLELNVRTYVVSGEKPGVWFFSLDASSRMAVRAARLLFHLPYFDARMSLEKRGDGILYRAERTHRKAPKARFRASYRGLGAPQTTDLGSLEQWLTDRYCLYAADRRGRIFRGDIHHPPWPLEKGEAEIETIDMTRLLGLELPPRRPLLHFAEQLDVVAWLLEPAD